VASAVSAARYPAVVLDGSGCSGQDLQVGAPSPPGSALITSRAAALKLQNDVCGVCGRGRVQVDMSGRGRRLGRSRLGRRRQFVFVVEAPVAPAVVPRHRRLALGVGRKPLFGHVPVVRSPAARLAAARHRFGRCSAARIAANVRQHYVARAV
jgi:hypothetical protein